MAAGLVLLSFAVAACSTTGADPAPQRVAILRAVPGSDIQDALLRLLADEGFVDGNNLEVLAADPSEVYPDADAARAAVDEWASQDVDLIIALSSVGASVAQRAAPDATIVFLVNDPTAVGLLQDEQQPEGRTTGVTFRVPADRTLTAAVSAIPGLRDIGLIYPEGDPAAIPHRDAVLDAGAQLGLRVRLAPFASADDVPEVVDRLASRGTDALVVANAPTAVIARDVIARSAKTHDLPLIANTSFFADALVVVQPDVPLLIEQLARQVARLLRGAPVADVPVEDPKRFELILNQRAADQLGLTLDPDLVRQATKVVR